MLVFSSVTYIETIQCGKKKKREPPNVTIIWSYVMLVLPNVKFELSDVSKKKWNHHM